MKNMEALMNREQELLTYHERRLLNTYDIVGLAGHKNNIVSSRAQILATVVSEKAPAIASHLIELSKALATNYMDFTLNYLD